MRIYISSEGGLMTDVFTPKSFIDFKIEEKMKKLDDRMVNYINRYRRERRKLQDERHDTPTKYRGVHWYDVLSSLSPEEQEEYQRLYNESRKRLRLKQGLVKQ
jgi:hypothetical protein